MSYLFALFFLLNSVHGRDVFFTLQYNRFASTILENNFLKDIINVNGALSTTLTANVGDTLHINVINLLDIENVDKLTVHWYGISQANTPWNDGVLGVTNCAIPYGGNYTYTFTVDTPGTYWYRPFGSDGTFAEGGYGLLIVHGKTPIASFDEERELILSESYHSLAREITAGLHNFGPSDYPYGYTPPPSASALIYLANDLKVVPGKTYLFHILNAAASKYLNIAVAGHILTLVQWGATPTVPRNFTSLDLAPGNRADVLIKTYPAGSAQAKLSYKIQVQTNWDGQTAGFSGTNVIPSNTLVFALNYTGATNLSSAVPGNEVKPYDGQFNEIVAVNPSPERTPNVTAVFNITQCIADPGTYICSSAPLGYVRYALNQQSYVRNTEGNILAATYFLLQSPAYALPAVRRSLAFTLGSVVRLVIQNTVGLNTYGATLSFHLHGFPVDVLGYGEGQFLQLPRLPRKKTGFPTDTFPVYCTGPRCRPLNGPVPPVNNSAIGEPCGWTVVQFTASARGLWLLSSTNEWSKALGMFTILEVEAPSVNLPDGFPLCGAVNANTKRNTAFPSVVGEAALMV